MSDKASELPAVTCDWCGRQNTERLSYCAGCGTRLVEPPVAECRLDRIRILRTLVIPGAIVFCVFFACFVFLGISFSQDLVWKWRVRGKINPAVLRAWAVQVISNKSPGFRAHDMLTNAPRYLVEPCQPMAVFPDRESVEVCYGGGFYHWGLAVGDTNFLPEPSHSRYFEKLAPGIYYWSGD